MSDPEPHPAAWAGLAMYGAIGAIAFAVSLDHAHQLFVDHGQDGWAGKALAVVVVLLAAGSVVEGVRRVRAQETLGPVIAAVLIGVGIEAWGNLATAKDSFSGYVIASVPTIVTLVVLWALESARSAASKRQAATEEQRRREAAEQEARAAREAAVRRAAAEERRRAEDERAAQAAAAEARRLAQIEAERREREAQRVAEREAQRRAQEAQAAAEREAQERAQRLAQEVAQAEAQRAAEEALRVAAEVAQRAKAQRSNRRSGPVEPPARVSEAEVLAVAQAYRLEHGELPTQSQLVELSGASLSNAKRVLKNLRETPSIHLVKSG